ncbi:DUF5367 family protein [Candidatus Haliotispira prima]|uniref:DUF5367 family protein n=1 Tax=Candidatus Haliotispira prima TaxID=3034016 RepID=A0ABY8MEU8_9SPIO|nr:DUF5367 family protein [Candidatus Haliotispira prima]
MQQHQFNQDFRSIVSRFCLVGIGFFVLFTVALYFTGAAVLRIFGSGFLFIGLLFIIFIVMTGLFLLCLRLTNTLPNQAPIAAISLCVPGMFLDTVTLRFLDKVLTPLAAFPLEFSSILMFAYASVIAISLVVYRI